MLGAPLPAGAVMGASVCNNGAGAVAVCEAGRPYGAGAGREAYDRRDLLPLWEGAAAAAGAVLGASVLDPGAGAGAWAAYGAGTGLLYVRRDLLPLWEGAAAAAGAVLGGSVL